MTSASTRTRLASAGRAALATAALLIGAASHAKPPPADPEVAGDVLIKLSSTGVLGPLLVKYQLSLVNQFGARPIYRLTVVGNANTHDKITALLTEPGVLIAEPNVVHSSPEARRNVAWTIGTPTAYVNQWAPTALRLPDAQRLTTGSGVRVAVLDTGVDTLHPALAGKLLPGFDFVDFDNDPGEVGTPLNFGFGHGTHVAGLVALVAPGAKIMPLRVLDPDGLGNAWVLAEAMLYAVDPDHNPATNDGAHIINMSLGSTSRTRIFDTITNLATCVVPVVPATPADDVSDPGYNGDKDRCKRFGGALIVAASGNDASKSIREYPAAEGAYGLIAVAASTVDLKLASFSNFGSWIQIAAPGEGLTSSVPGGGYGTWSGTSMAAPMVAGTAALVRALNPRMQPVDVAKRLTRISANLCGTKLRQVDAAAALQNIVPADKPCP